GVTWSLVDCAHRSFFYLTIRSPPRSPLFPYTTLFRSTPASRRIAVLGSMKELGDFSAAYHAQLAEPLAEAKVDHAVLVGDEMRADRKSTRLNSSHVKISYAVFCLKKKNTGKRQ